MFLRRHCTLTRLLHGARSYGRQRNSKELRDALSKKVDLAKRIAHLGRVDNTGENFLSLIKKRRDIAAGAASLRDAASATPTFNPFARTVLASGGVEAELEGAGAFKRAPLRLKKAAPSEHISDHDLEKQHEIEVRFAMRKLMGLHHYQKRCTNAEKVKTDSFDYHARLLAERQQQKELNAIRHQLKEGKITVSTGMKNKLPTNSFPSSVSNWMNKEKKSEGTSIWSYQGVQSGAKHLELPTDGEIDTAMAANRVAGGSLYAMETRRRAFIVTPESTSQLIATFDDVPFNDHAKYGDSRSVDEILGSSPGVSEADTSQSDNSLILGLTADAEEVEWDDEDTSTYEPFSTDDEEDTQPNAPLKSKGKLKKGRKS